MDNAQALELRRKLEEALDHINAVRELLSKPIPARDAKRFRELASADLETAAIRIVGSITTIRT